LGFILKETKAGKQMLVKKKTERESVREKWKKRYLNLAKA
jgi:hypothetical protein